MASVEALQDKVRKLKALLDSDKAPDSLTGSECVKLGHLSMLVGTVVNDFQRTEQKGKHIKNAMKSLDEIERDANKILNKGGGKFKYVAIAIGLMVLYVVFK